MGNCIGSEDKRSLDDVDDVEVIQKEVKLVLIGPQGSGKSTIIKQMKLIHGEKFTMEEREAYKEIIFSNILNSMRTILEVMDNMELSLHNDANYTHFNIIMSTMSDDSGYMSRKIADAIRNLWFDPSVERAFQRDCRHNLNDSVKYFFDSIDRIAQKTYIPTDQDVLQTYIKTTGITETTFLIGDLKYGMFDVGGKRSERKKWIHCFEYVTAIIFLVAISEYDQLVLEDDTVNRIQEALTLFDSICNSRWFIKTSLILFLNKIDRFKEKLPVSPMKNYFSDYEGGDDYGQASQYILNRFISLRMSDTKQIYTHFTCATDTSQIKLVMATVNDIVIQTNLQYCSML